MLAALALLIFPSTLQAEEKEWSHYFKERSGPLHYKSRPLCEEHAAAGTLDEYLATDSEVPVFSVFFFDNPSEILGLGGYVPPLNATYGIADTDPLGRILAGTVYTLFFAEEPDEKGNVPEDALRVWKVFGYDEWRDELLIDTSFAGDREKGEFSVNFRPNSPTVLKSDGQGLVYAPDQNQIYRLVGQIYCPNLDAGEFDTRFREKVLGLLYQWR